MRSEVQLFLGPPSKPVPAGYGSALADARFGALAQLGERLICIQEVSGSIPLGSTIRHLRRTKEVYRFRTPWVWDICHCKGKIDPAGRHPSWVCVTSLSRITGRAAMCGIGKGSVCKKPTCLIEIHVCGERVCVFHCTWVSKTIKRQKGIRGMSWR